MDNYADNGGGTLDGQIYILVVKGEGKHGTGRVFAISSN